MKMIGKSVLAIGSIAGLLAAGAAAAIYSGAYDVGADAPHTRPVYALLETARKRSISVRADDLQVPVDIGDPARIRQGAGNYDAMCTGCHLTPGAGETELSKGLYPKPPNLSLAQVRPAEAFWAIKHGIKASGMPAWGKSMDDEYIWNMAAFLQELPKLDKARYDALVAGSGGHSHGGGETAGHAHAEADGAHHEETAADGHTEGANHREEGVSPAGDTHTHADGSRHVHAPKTGPAERPAEPAQAPETNEPPTGDSHADMPMPKDDGHADGHDHH